MSEHEPRFAGEVTPVAPPAHPPLEQPPPAQPPPAQPPPVVVYQPDPGAQPDAREAPTAPALPLWVVPVLGTAGGLLALVGSTQTWASLSFPGSSSFDSGNQLVPPQISYSGVTLIEGRCLLAVGIVALAISLLLALQRLRPAVGAGVLIGVGLLGLAMTAFSMIGHPSELATLFRTEGPGLLVKARLPNGAGVFIAMGGTALILVGGLLGYLRRRQDDRSA